MPVLQAIREGAVPVNVFTSDVGAKQMRIVRR